MATKANSKGRPVVITTAHRGVFFGYTREKSTTIISRKHAEFRDVRNCLYWASNNKGFIGLAVDGPLSGSRVGPSAKQLALADITSVTDCTPAAAKAWESAPWRS